MAQQVMTFFLGTHRNKPQWKHFSEDKQTVHVPHENGLQPTDAQKTWIVEEDFSYVDRRTDFKLIVMKLIEPVLKKKTPAPPATEEEQIASTGIQPKHGIIHISNRNLKKAGDRSQTSA